MSAPSRLAPVWHCPIRGEGRGQAPPFPSPIHCGVVLRPGALLWENTAHQREQAVPRGSCPNPTPAALGQRRDEASPPTPPHPTGIPFMASATPARFCPVSSGDRWLGLEESRCITPHTPGEGLGRPPGRAPAWARPWTPVCQHVSQGVEGRCPHWELWSQSPFPGWQSWGKTRDKRPNLEGRGTTSGGGGGWELSQPGGESWEARLPARTPLAQSAVSRRRSAGLLLPAPQLSPHLTPIPSL